MMQLSDDADWELVDTAEAVAIASTALDSDAPSVVVLSADEATKRTCLRGFTLDEPLVGGGDGAGDCSLSWSVSDHVWLPRVGIGAERQRASADSLTALSAVSPVVVPEDPDATLRAGAGRACSAVLVCEAGSAAAGDAGGGITAQWAGVVAVDGPAAGEVLFGLTMPAATEPRLPVGAPLASCIVDRPAASHHGALALLAVDTWEDGAVTAADACERRAAGAGPIEPALLLFGGPGPTASGLGSVLPLRAILRSSAVRNPAAIAASLRSSPTSASSALDTLDVLVADAASGKLIHLPFEIDLNSGSIGLPPAVVRSDDAVVTSRAGALAGTLALSVRRRSSGALEIRAADLLGIHAAAVEAAAGEEAAGISEVGGGAGNDSARSEESLGLSSDAPDEGDHVAAAGAGGARSEESLGLSSDAPDEGDQVAAAGAGGARSEESLGLSSDAPGENEPAASPAPAPEQGAQWELSDSFGASSGEEDRSGAPDIGESERFDRRAGEEAEDEGDSESQSEDDRLDQTGLRGVGSILEEEEAEEAGGSGPVGVTGRDLGAPTVMEPLDLTAAPGPAPGRAGVTVQGAGGEWAGLGAREPPLSGDPAAEEQLHAAGGVADISGFSTPAAATPERSGGPAPRDEPKSQRAGFSGVARAAAHELLHSSLEASQEGKEEEAGLGEHRPWGDQPPSGVAAPSDPLTRGPSEPSPAHSQTENQQRIFLPRVPQHSRSYADTEASAAETSLSASASLLGVLPPVGRRPGHAPQGRPQQQQQQQAAVDARLALKEALLGPQPAGRPGDAAASLASGATGASATSVLVRRAQEQWLGKKAGVAGPGAAAGGRGGGPSIGGRDLLDLHAEWLRLGQEAEDLLQDTTARRRRAFHLARQNRKLLEKLRSHAAELEAGGVRPSLPPTIDPEGSATAEAVQRAVERRQRRKERRRRREGGAGAAPGDQAHSLDGGDQGRGLDGGEQAEEEPDGMDRDAEALSDILSYLTGKGQVPTWSLLQPGYTPLPVAAPTADDTHAAVVDDSRQALLQMRREAAEAAAEGVSAGLQRRWGSLSSEPALPPQAPLYAAEPDVDNELGRSTKGRRAISDALRGLDERCVELRAISEALQTRWVPAAAQAAEDAAALRARLEGTAIGLLSAFYGPPDRSRMGASNSSHHQAAWEEAAEAAVALDAMTPDEARRRREMAEAVRARMEQELALEQAAERSRWEKHESRMAALRSELEQLQEEAERRRRRRPSPRASSQQRA